MRKGEASIVTPNRLQWQFNPEALDERWVTDITYIRTHEGCLYLAVVVDLFSRKIIGWSMQPRITKDIVLNALLMPVWRRNPLKLVLVHSDQGSQYTSHRWQSFLKSHGLEGSMSRRGNCHDNAVAESFFQLLKRERIKKKIYVTGEEARSDIFDYIEMFYNSKRRHCSSDQMPPTEYEKSILSSTQKCLDYPWQFNLPGILLRYRRVAANAKTIRFTMQTITVLELDDPLWRNGHAEAVSISHFLWARIWFTMNGKQFCVADSHK